MNVYLVAWLIGFIITFWLAIWVMTNDPQIKREVSTLPNGAFAVVMTLICALWFVTVPFVLIRKLLHK